MAHLFNNCCNRDHVRIFGEGAFFDLDLRGRQASMAQDLGAGDKCIVASYGDRPSVVVFDWYTFTHEERMADETGEIVRVMHGVRTRSEVLDKTTAARTAPYEHLFNCRGQFKQRSVVRPR